MSEDLNEMLDNIQGTLKTLVLNLNMLESSFVRMDDVEDRRRLGEKLQDCGKALEDGMSRCRNLVRS